MTDLVFKQRLFKPVMRQTIRHHTDLQNQTKAWRGIL
jgi:hypothetical protein